MMIAHKKTKTILQNYQNVAFRVDLCSNCYILAFEKRLGGKPFRFSKDNNCQNRLNLVENNIILKYNNSNLFSCLIKKTLFIGNLKKYLLMNPKSSPEQTMMLPW